MQPDLSIQLRQIDLTATPEEDRYPVFNLVARDETNKPFDLAAGPLLRASLFSLSDHEHILLLILHHIITDGWSMNVLVRELSELYTSYQSGFPAQLPQLPIQFGDYATWQREWLQGEVLDRQLDYWTQKLTGLPPVLEIPADRPRPPVASNQGALAQFEVGAEVANLLKAFCQHEGVTPYMVLLAVYQLLLYRISGQSDIAVGTAIANRTRSEIEHLVGFFVNTLVMRTDLSSAPSFRELVKRVPGCMPGCL